MSTHRRLPMSNMPSLTPRDVLEVLFRAGFEKIRTTGSHIRLRKESYQVTVPFHAKRTLPKGTMMSIIHQSGMSRDQFLSYRKK